MPTPDSVGPLAVDATLHLLADRLVDDLAADRLAPSLLHVSAVDSDGYSVGFLPLGGRHPSDLLVGFTAPHEWHALGMAAGGSAHRLDQVGRPPERVHVISLLTRSGEYVHRTRLQGGGQLACDLAAEQPSGEQVDLLRLALGMATPPPPCESGAYFAAEWLSALLGTDREELRSWDDVCRAHPVMALLASSSRHRDDDFVDIAASFARACTWSRLRELTAAGRFAAPGLVAADGPWFDDGAFARYLLNRCPPLSMLRRQARDHLRPALAERLDGVLAELDVPEATWPDVRGAA